MFDFFGDFNDANLLFLGGLPRWVLWGACGIALMLLVLTWVDLRDQSRGRRVLLVSLRTLALGVAALLLLEPALELRHITKIRNHVVFLVDSSLSMTLPHDDERSRWDVAREVTEAGAPLLGEDDEDHLYHVFRFDETLHESTLAEVSGLSSPTGTSTQLLEALEAVGTSFPRRELGGVVLVSDGSDSGVLGGRVHRGEALDAESRALIEALGAPIHVVVTGNPDELFDLAIERVLVDDFAFVRNRVSVEVVIRSFGFDAGLIPVTLRRGSDVLQTREVTLTEGVNEYRVTFDFIPEQIGKEIYSVSVVNLANDHLETNNHAFFLLKVIRDKIRVLQVCGRPSWDERFLREFMKRNPNVDLISFFILRTDANLQLVTESELSLIPFPTEELFSEQLGSFDLVIFQNFTYRPYGMFRYLAHISDYVRNGGAFVMVGGEQAFASGGYTGTPIADVLPVFLPPQGPQEVIVDETPFQPVLTDAGRRHPITQLEFSPVDNEEAWNTLPEQIGTNIVLAPRPEATVLLEHPLIRSGGQPLPVLSVMDVDEGRSMALTTDSSWRWSFMSVARGGTSRGYTSFWNSAVRWLIQDPELRLIQVEAPQNNVEPQSPFEVTVRVFEPDYFPAILIEGAWELTVQPLTHQGAVEAASLVETGIFTTDERGRATLELTVSQEGAYTFTASVTLGDAGEETDADIFLVQYDHRELRDVLPRPDLLEALAEASGGEFGESLDPVELSFREAETVQVNRRRIVELWNTPWLLGFMVILIGVDWSFRRRWGRL